MQDNEFQAEGFRLLHAVDGSHAILSFQDAQERQVDIRLDVDHLVQLCAEVARTTGTNTLRPIAPRDVRIGTSFQLSGFQAQRSRHGVSIALHLRVDDSLRTLPIDLSLQAARQLASDLQEVS